MRTFAKIFIVVLSFFLVNKVFCQNNVGIGTTTPDSSAILDLTAFDKGLLTPRLSSAQRTAIATPATGLLVYDTNFNEFWYYNGVAWVSLSSNNQWGLTGNVGTDPNVNFIGTTDLQPFIIKTGGANAGNERLRVLSNGTITINNPIPNPNDAFSVYGTGTTGALNPLGIFSICGYANDSLGAGIYGENKNINGTGIYGKSFKLGYGVFGENDSLGDGVWGYNSGFGAGVRGQSTGAGVGVVGTNDGSGQGVYGYNSNSGFGVTGVNTDTLAGAGHGVYGQASYEQSFAVYGYNTDSSGTGVVGVGNNVTSAYLTNGSGAAFTGRNIGVFGSSAITGSDTTAGGYFVSGNSYAYVGAFDGALNRKVVGNGTVNTIVNDVNNNPVLFSAPEAPENLFNDYGTGQLINGKVSISLDPTFAKNIAVNEKHPLRVFIQLEGDCKGVYVTNKTKNGFDVIELNGGNSNVPFTWFVCANRADEVGTNGFVLKYSEERFGKAPKPLQEKISPKIIVKKPNSKNTIRQKRSKNTAN